MPKKNLVAIYEHLFKEGVMVAKKDPHAPKHPELDVPNLQVMKTLNSLKSRGYVKEQFAWRHYYWYLTNEGIQVRANTERDGEKKAFSFAGLGGKSFLFWGSTNK